MLSVVLVSVAVEQLRLAENIFELIYFLDEGNLFEQVVGHAFRIEEYVTKLTRNDGSAIAIWQEMRQGMFLRMRLSDDGVMPRYDASICSGTRFASLG